MVTKGIEERDAAYRAIGRYVVEFSELVWSMRSLIETRLAGPLAGESPEAEPTVERNRNLVELVLGEATAQPIANVLFGMCRIEGNLDPAEERLAMRCVIASTKRSRHETTSRMAIGLRGSQAIRHGLRASVRHASRR